MHDYVVRTKNNGNDAPWLCSIEVIASALRITGFIRVRIVLYGGGLV